MQKYTQNQTFAKINYKQDDLNFQDFEACVFVGCNFSECLFIAVVFIDCEFHDCNFTQSKINHVSFRGAHFFDSKLIDVNFSMTNKTIFSISFDNCILDYSKFYALNLQYTLYRNCSLRAVDFMDTNLFKTNFENCDLYQSEFSGAKATQTNFKSSKNYCIDPRKTILKKAIFCKQEVKGLLFKHEINFV
jgi:uncharacterized protein YjbI with pentapeptide repeats